MKNKKVYSSLSLSLFVFAFLLYSNTLNHDFALDDEVFISLNSFVQDGLKGIGDIFSHGSLYGFNQSNDPSYRPLVLTTFAIEKSIFGNDPFVYHLFSVIFYAISIVILFVFLKKLFRNKSILMPLFIALIFAAHPIHTEVVANIKSRDEILFFMFAVLTFSYLLDYLFKEKLKFLILSLFFFILSFLSKEHAITLLGIIPLLIYFFCDVRFKKGILITSYFFGVALIFLLIRHRILGTNTFEGDIGIINNTLLGADSFMDRNATIFVHLLIYFKLLFVPYPLVFDYSFNQIPITTWADGKAIAGFLIYLALGIYAVIRFKKNDVFSFCILFYFISLSISSNIFITIGATMAERFLFTPSMAFCISVVFIIILLLKIKGNRITIFKRNLLILIIGIITLVFSIITINRNRDWENNITLAFADLHKSPNSARVRSFTANAYLKLSKLENDPQKQVNLLNKSIEEYKHSVEIYPSYTESYYNIGICYDRLGDKQNALKAYYRAIENNPTYALANNNIGIIYYKQNDFSKALIYFKKASESNPQNIDYWYNIGVAYFHLQDYENSKKYFFKVTSYDPDFKDAFINLAAIYINTQEYNEAIKVLEIEIQKNPGNKVALREIARIYKILGNIEKAKYYSAMLQ